MALYKKLAVEKKEAEKILREPRPAGVTRKQLKDHREKRMQAFSGLTWKLLIWFDFWKQKLKICSPTIIPEAKKNAKRNIQKMCREEFPDLVGKTQVCKWVQAAADEHWDLLPEPLRARLCTTSNEWKIKMNIGKLRGRSVGGSIPLSLQKELDYLMLEFSSGMSRVTDRREIITLESIVTCAK